MQSNYFPYSEIITNNENSNNVKRHTFLGDWHVGIAVRQPETKTSLPTISEIYY